MAGGNSARKWSGMSVRSKRVHAGPAASIRRSGLREYHAACFVVGVRQRVKPFGQRSFSRISSGVILARSSQVTRHAASHALLDGLAAEHGDVFGGLSEGRNAPAAIALPLHDLRLSACRHSSLRRSRCPGPPACSCLCRSPRAAPSPPPAAGFTAQRKQQCSAKRSDHQHAGAASSLSVRMSAPLQSAPRNGTVVYRNVVAIPIRQQLVFGLYLEILVRLIVLRLHARMRVQLAMFEDRGHRGIRGAVSPPTAEPSVPPEMPPESPTRQWPLGAMPKL